MRSAAAGLVLIAALMAGPALADLRPPPKDPLLPEPLREPRYVTPGKAEVECTVKASGALGPCKVVSESPPGEGFGRATLHWTEIAHVDPARYPPGAVLRIPVDWSDGHSLEVADGAPTPNALRSPEPPYPAEARERGEHGEVVVRGVVQANGAMTGVSVEQSSRSEALDAAALAAFRSWTFEQAEPDDKRPLSVTRRFSFQKDTTYEGVEHKSCREAATDMAWFDRTHPDGNRVKDNLYRAAFWILQRPVDEANTKGTDEETERVMALYRAHAHRFPRVFDAALADCATQPERPFMQVVTAQWKASEAARRVGRKARR